MMTGWMSSGLSPHGMEIWIWSKAFIQGNASKENLEIFQHPDDRLHDVVPRLRCGDCAHWNKDCRRTCDGHIRIAKTPHGTYDNGLRHGVICRDFEPGNGYPVLQKEWRGYDAWRPCISDQFFVLLDVDGVRHLVSTRRWVDGTHLDANGNLLWTARMIKPARAIKGNVRPAVYEWSEPDAIKNLYIAQEG